MIFITGKTKSISSYFGKQPTRLKTGVDNCVIKRVKVFNYLQYDVSNNYNYVLENIYFKYICGRLLRNVELRRKLRKNTLSLGKTFQEIVMYELIENIAWTAETIVRVVVDN